ncbi:MULTISPECIES: TrkH family potassium uptake protein [Planococcus]|uniref:Ktr system potassium transporter B n=1 Tax=Planococcus faecalis TaxID=1598147 RepID=A0ABN4XHT2_9BACL|nr:MULTISPECIES: TrkH family potassium uptake protein [Planococcus]AQU78351.1 Ktr system potassium transporter B [Planococcus faecalis]KAA0955314.1 Ktr system potassium transporter B [Planococcus sp. ANT_H30]MDJ0331847.1 TrkH family potassium uptake protein [Planococcus sp. S3-L1]
MQSWKKKRMSISPPLVISGSFLFLIMTGTLLLKLPFATTQPISWTDALFTATSATTVTGLSVFDPATVLTGFGELVLLVLIQCGGIGLMTFAVAILILFRKKVGLQNRIYLQESLTQSSIGGVVKLVKSILTFALTVEAVATVLLTIYWTPEFGFKDALNYSVFHVISAFNNAGFSLFPDNMISFAGDPLVTILLSSLFIIGGIGFTVVMDIAQKKSFHRWSLHTKLMIGGTLILNAVATIVIFILEYNNPGTLGNMSLYEKLSTSYFSAVTPRTAGFNMLNYGELEDPTLLFTMLLMFIGGGSASTASGIKLTTFIVVILATVSFLKSRREPELFGRSIRLETVIRSLAITTISVLLVVLFLFLLTVSEKIPFLPLAFEVVSAFGTVGLSMGITGDLSSIGEVLLSLVMFTGRIGPLTLFFILMKPRKENYRYPYDPVFTG